MKKIVCLRMQISLLGWAWFVWIGIGTTSAQQLGATQAPVPENEEADAELERLLKNQSSADTAFVNLRFGLFGPSAKNLYEAGQRWAMEDRWNIALAHWYRTLDRNNKKYNDLATKGITEYGPKFLSKCTSLSIQAFNRGDGRSGYLYAFRLVREINKAGEYKVRIVLSSSEFQQLNTAAEDWAQRRLTELQSLVATRKHFTLVRELEAVGTYVPESRKSNAYRALEQEIETNGVRVVALPMFRGGEVCAGMPDLVHAGFMDRLGNQHRLIKVTSREINNELEAEKIFAEIDDRPLLSDLKANLPGADYLIVGKVLTCDEKKPSIRRTTLDAWQVRAYTVKDTSGNDVTKYCYDTPVKLEAVTGSSSVSYTVALSTYRVADGKVIYTRKLDKSYGSTVDYLYAPRGVTDVSTVKITEGSTDAPKRFERAVEVKFREAVAISDLRKQAADELNQLFAVQVFEAIVADN